MKSPDSFLNLYKQNNKLPIRLTTPTFGGLPPEVLESYGLTHRKPNYFFLLMVDGATRHGVDGQQFNVKANELLFILPNQIHQLPISKQGADYYKLSFDENCLALLPKQFSFLINPLNNQKIRLMSDAASRLASTFAILLDLLRSMDTNPTLMPGYLNSLLIEIDLAYFSNAKDLADNRLKKFIDFKVYIENNFIEHPSVSQIAEALTCSISGLYGIVKHYSGQSPKEFIINRLILEARRRLYYSESSSIKTLAYDLGFNDPEYFSRLFKKTTGKTIEQFNTDLSGS